MTDIDTLIAEVRRLDCEATPGPWAPQVISHQWTHIPCGPPYEGPSTDRRGMEGTAHNARLIATFRNAAPILAAEVQRLRAELEEQRLTLAAEQGRQEGAPSDRWRHLGLGTWINEHTGASVRRGGWPVTGPGESIWTLPSGATGTAPTARAAMQAADAAQEPR